MKKIIFCTALILFFRSGVFAQTVYDENYTESPNYVQGMKYYENSQYASAISEFKKALRYNTRDTSSLIGLSNSYNMRAQYYNNTVKKTDIAVSDIKSAIFFLRYFASDYSDFKNAQSLSAMEKNLSLLENAGGESVTPEKRAENARKYRIKGEFAASAFDYYQILNNEKYAKEANCALGDIYKIFSRPEKSVTFYRNALKISPDDTDIHLKLAGTYELLNDYNAALSEYTLALNTAGESEGILSSLEKIWQKKVDENPKDAEAHANLGVVLQKEKRYDEALNEYKTAEQLNPSNLNTKINIGTLYQERKKYDSAISVYDSVLRLQPHNTAVTVYKADCLKALNKNDEAIELYKIALNSDSKNPEIKAKLFDLMKDTMPADKVLDYLYKNVQNSPVSADSYYEFAYELHKAGKINDAIVYYSETLKLDKNKIDAYVNLSQAYRQMKNYDASYDIMQKASTVAPNDELVKKQFKIAAEEYSANKYSIASNAFQSGEFNKAIAEYSKINPPTADSYIGIAASYQSLKINKEAIENYKKAMELDPRNSDLPFYIASIMVNENDLTGAKQYIEIALAKNPNNTNAKELSKYLFDKDTEIMLSGAVKLYEEQKYTEAIEMFSKVLSATPNNATVYYYRAMSFDALNDYQKAIDDYKSTLKYAPEMNIAYYSLGVDYDTVGNYKSAKENYQKYVANSIEDNDYKKYALSRIEEIKE